MDKGFLEGCLARGMSLNEIGKRAHRDPSTVAYWLKKLGLTANGSVRHAPKGGLSKEQLLPLVERGLTLRELADELDRSVGTVRHWLKRHGITRPRQWRRAEGRTALSEGRKRIHGVCLVHGDGDFVVFADGRTRCARCNSDGVARRRRKVKQILVEEAGGQCLLCGYSAYVGALQFHHRDPALKSFSVSQNGNTISLERARAEVRKCVLLCANCHAEVEAGVASLSAAG